MAKRKSGNETAATHWERMPVGGCKIVGLDIGYGRVKGVCEGKRIIFPSVAGKAITIKFRAEEIEARYPGERLTDGDGEWFIGNLAMSQLPTGDLRSLRGRTGDEAEISHPFRVRMMKGALAKLFEGVEDGSQINVVISSGLPVDHMGDREGLIRALCGTHEVRTDRGYFSVCVERVIVMPQPYGGMYSRMLTAEGEVNKNHTATTTTLVDVGHFSVDVATDRDGEYVDAMSGSVEAGVFMAYERIAALMERDLREKPHPSMVEELLRTGEIKGRGKVETRYAKAVAEAVRSLQQATLQLAGEKIQSGARVDEIFIGGGGAGLVEKAVVAAYPHAHLLHDPQFANAIGYERYGKMAQGEE